MSNRTRRRVWVPDLKESPPIEVTYPAALLAGFFTVELLDAKTKVVLQRYEFPNLLVDAGFDAIGNGTDALITLHTFIAAGTDNTSPTTANTTLGAELTRSNDNEGIVDLVGFTTGSTWPTNKSGSYHWRRINRVFYEDGANGNLTELGVFDAATGGTMLLRQLIKDSTGTPITLTKTSANQLRVVHELRLYPPSDVISGTVIVGAATYSHTSSILNMDNQDAWGFTTNGVARNLGVWAWGVLALPSASVIIDQTGTVANFSAGGDAPFSKTNLNYIGGTFYQEMRAVWTSSHADFGPGGVTGFGANSVGGLDQGTKLHQILMSPAIPKVSGQKLVLVFRQPYSRTVI